MANHVILARRPGAPLVADDFAMHEQSLDAMTDGDVHVENRWVSIDPYMRPSLGTQGQDAGSPLSRGPRSKLEVFGAAQHEEPRERR